MDTTNKTIDLHTISKVSTDEKFETDEILLIENPNRHVIFPIKYFDIWE